MLFPSYLLDRSDEAVGVLADDASLTGFAQQRFYGWGFNRDVVYATDGVSNRSITYLRCGWPMRCLSGTDTTGIGLQHAIEVPEWLASAGGGGRRWGGRFFLPTQPMWLGFVVNTAFYAVVAWVMISAPFVLRRWQRIKRGRCVRCGYDLQGNAGGAKCPECGALR